MPTLFHLLKLINMQYCSVPLGVYSMGLQENTAIIMEELGWQTDELEGFPTNLTHTGKN